MKVREPPKTSFEMDMQLDRISDLPSHIIEQILSHLSIRDAVRTSILSSKWRYKWATIPHLVFDNQCLSVPSQDQATVKSKLLAIIDHVLLLHMGPICKFKLSHRDLLAINDIDRWILYLSRGSIKEFVLEIWKGQRYFMPSCLFSCQNLTHLELFNCLLKPPLTFKGFKCLKSLDLQHVTMTQHVFEYMISSCPMLEKLTLMNFDGFSHLNIEAPNLKFFDVGGVFTDVSFKNTFGLAVVSIGLYGDANDQNRCFSNSSNLQKFFDHLPVIRRLEIQSYFLKYLAVGILLGKTPKLCVDLDYLSIRISFNDLEETSTALCILRIAPNLQELEILARPEENTGMETVTNFWEYDYWSCLFTQLKLVKITGVSGTKSELDFINFMLLRSPVLESMTVKPASENGGLEFVKALLRFRRASVQAEIVFLDP
ncbi:hypothetical protein FEM48_Zijuj06G0076500 [Ziziphus jujuba var. spinosa]|uniref:F-box domain-containing protein n=1 Tax=Ziziphus jujuba var. spinosa TaxID=714518 RepID=A0A978V809_ZIZJJ|nr:hypothetical protein FEM48_Zijuj06G0076500 [Ziziphus jujuba var. spinosa]